jgi:hypothetical protein
MALWQSSFADAAQQQCATRFLKSWGDDVCSTCLGELSFDHRCDPSDIAIAQHACSVRDTLRSTPLLQTIQSAHAFERTGAERPAPISMEPSFFHDAGGQDDSENDDDENETARSGYESQDSYRDEQHNDSDSDSVASSDSYRSHNASDWFKAGWFNTDWFDTAGFRVQCGLGHVNAMVVIGVFHLLFLFASIVNDGSTNLWRFLPSELTSELLLFSLVRSSSSRWHVSTIIVIGGFTHLIICASIANEGSLREMRSELLHLEGRGIGLTSLLHLEGRGIGITSLLQRSPRVCLTPPSSSSFSCLCFS